VSSNLKYISPSQSPYITDADDPHTNVDGCGEVDLQSLKSKYGFRS